MSDGSWIYSAVPSLRNAIQSGGSISSMPNILGGHDYRIDGNLIGSTSDNFIGGITFRESGGSGVFTEMGFGAASSISGPDGFSGSTHSNIFGGSDFFSAGPGLSSSSMNLPWGGFSMRDVGSGQSASFHENIFGGHDFRGLGLTSSVDQFNQFSSNDNLSHFDFGSVSGMYGGVTGFGGDFGEGFDMSGFEGIPDLDF